MPKFSEIFCSGFVVFKNISLWRMGIISYIVRIPLLQMTYNIFLHFLYGPYLVVFKNNSLCKMGDNELYSKKPLVNFWHFCRGHIRSVLRKKSVLVGE